MRKKVWTSVVAVVVGVLIWGIYVAVRAHSNLVTLDVREMEVREVVKKIEWQTWERIFVNKNVQGKITLNVRKMALDEVLNIIDEQVSSRWSKIYPLYSTSKSLVALKQSLRGEIDPSANGWTNLQSRSTFRGGGGGGTFGDNVLSQNRLVSLQFQGKDVSFATLALGRYSQARVVPEDGTSATVSLKLNQAPIPEAVAQLAKQARRNWTTCYVLQGEGGRRGPGGPGAMASRDPNAEDGGGRRGRDGSNLTPEQRDEMRLEREKLAEELKEALPPAERQKLEQAQQQREQQRQDFQNMTPEQRQAQFANNNQWQQRGLARIKNTTPEQKVERYREREQRRQRWQQRPSR